MLTLKLIFGSEHVNKDCNLLPFTTVNSGKETHLRNQSNNDVTFEQVMEDIQGEEYFKQHQDNRNLVSMGKPTAIEGAAQIGGNLEFNDSDDKKNSEKGPFSSDDLKKHPNYERDESSRTSTSSITTGNQ